MAKLKGILLTEGMHGMISQVEGLAKALDIDFTHHKVELNHLWKFIPPNLSPVSQNVFKKIDHDDFDVIISCGRKSVIPSIHLKNTSNKKVFNIHIQDPKVDLNHFDFIVAPEHDGIEGDNVISTKGAIHYLTENEISENKDYLNSFIKKDERKIWTLIMGGPTKYYDYSTKNMKHIFTSLYKLLKKHDFQLVVIPSMRTPINTIHYAKEFFGDNHTIIMDVDKKAYLSADPFPHIILDDFFQTSILDDILNEFPNLLKLSETQNYNVKNEIKLSNKNYNKFPSTIKLFFDEDSIYHPSVQFSYDKSKRKLQLYRDGKGVSGSPIINSYHQLTMDAELLEWQIDDEFIYLGSTPATSVSSVQFESIANYQEAKFHELQGIDAINPLMLVNKYVKKSGNNEFSARDFAHFSGYPEIQIQHYLMNLANKGFLYYNIAQHRVTVLEKLNNYVNAKLQKGDYDVIRFSSNIKQTNGSGMIVNSSINLNSKDLVIQGVGIVSLSDSQRVYIQPYNGKIELKKNRDFQFDGKISAGNGRFILFGKQFNFTYDQFKVDLNQIDSVQLSVPKIPIVRDMYGNEKLVRVKTVLEAVTGYLRIDHPNNKSGLRKDSFPEYPIFTSFEDSYAYYDRPGTFNGVYNRDDFSFHLQPFEIDSLENFTGKGLRFPGTFESANIFPIFDDTLTLQKDYSLGFDRVTPDQGFEIYGGKAHYFNEIHLSHEGLKGKGKFEYLTSVSSSDEIYFFPD